MKANELRIGNWVFDKLNKVSQIEHISKDGEIKYSTILYEYDGASYIDIDTAKPIPLTEEWLLKFGFEINPEKIIDDKETNEYRCNDFTMVIQNGKFYATNGGIELISELSIEYVHQLQNLCFALTGEELIMKE